MAPRIATMPPEAPPCEHFDVLVVGAGISGIDAGYHLQTSLPHKTYAIFEAREAIGGTWDLFRYPGIRSDSDMYTLGFPFRPWHSDRAIVDGDSIRQYIADTARDYGIDRKIRFQHRVTRADWSAADQRWNVEVHRADSGATLTVTCSFLMMCSGYYRYDEAYAPAFPNAERFNGPIIHPQFWPDGLDYEDKRVIVIGSGATAVTLVPALAEKAAHVTMLQRSPSYVLSVPGDDSLAAAARRLLSPARAYALIRWKNALFMTLLFQLSRRRPELVKKLLRRGIERLLGPTYDIDTHFTPRYNPWEQRMCFVRDADLFETISLGHAEVVTDEIDSFTEGGIRLASGRELDADIVVSATGLNLRLFNGVDLTLDGEAVNLADRLLYRGCMLSDVPNLAFTFGYTNASWTLRCDLTCRYVCRLLAHMDQHAYASSTPRNRDSSMSRHPFADFSSGYFLRVMDHLPKQGSKPPWRLHQNYLLDTFMLRTIPIDEPSMEFTRATHAAADGAARSRLAAAA
jgi:cation diffusion facilitator CzcD-associated flavoprotein CzcO